MEAAERTHEPARRQDALWSNYLSGTVIVGIDPKAALGRLEAAGLKPGDELRCRDSALPLDDFVQGLTGGPMSRESIAQHQTPQSRLTLDLLMGNQVPRTLSDAQEKHVALGK